jgi:hypothetical protein
MQRNTQPHTCILQVAARVQNHLYVGNIIVHKSRDCLLLNYRKFTTCTSAILHTIHQLDECNLQQARPCPDVEYPISDCLASTDECLADSYSC